MKKVTLFVGVVMMVLAITGMTEVYALDLGQEITIPDLMGSGSGWHGSQEDNETEPGTITNQTWDLEAFFLNGTTLNMLGGYDFVNNSQWKYGDIFIDVDNDIKYGLENDGSGSVQNGNSTVANSFGYDYVLDLNFDEVTGVHTYDVYAITANTTVRTVHYNINQESNAWRYESGGEAVLLGQTLAYSTYTTDELATYGYIFQDDGTSNLHNIVSVDLGFLGAEISNFTAHFTMECGNDNLMGHYDPVPPVPEPSTVLLLGAGIIGLAGFARKRVKK
jgi:hypothetical protein